MPQPTDSRAVRTGPSLIARLCLGVVFLAYLLTTVALFFWGPWQYPVSDGRGRFILFLGAVHVAFAVGYLWGIRGGPRSVRIRVGAGTLVLVASVAELLLLLPTSVVNTGSWIPRPGAALQNLAAAYTGSLTLRETSGPYVNYVRMLLAPVLALAAPLGVFYWTQLSGVARATFALSVLGSISLFVAMGANAGAAHWMALFPWFVLAGHLSGVQKLTARGWVCAIAVQALSVLLFVGLFTASMNQRTGSFAKYGRLPGVGAELVTRPAPVPADAQHAPSLSRPAAPVGAGGLAGDGPQAPSPSRSAARVGADGLAGYLTQGYYAVYLSLQEPFVPGYGVGNSVFLQRQAARLLGQPDILKRPYPERIQARGWNAYGYWASIYPWIASDVTFPGVVLVMLLIGWLTGRVWVDVLGGGNPFAVALLGQLLILLYYIPAHNKVMHAGEGVLAFWTLLLLWGVSRTRQGRPER